MGDDGRMDEMTGPDAAGIARRRAWPVLVAAAVVALLLDLASKITVVAVMTPGVPVPWLGDWGRFLLVRNPGAAFSMATGLTWVLTVVALVVVAGIIRYGRRLTSVWWALGLGLVLGGALGNLVDRFFRAPGPMRGYVVDFLSFGGFPVFNLADSAITVGAVLLVLLTVFGVEPTAAGPVPTAAPADRDGEAAGPDGPAGAGEGPDTAAEETARTDPGGTDR